MGCLRYTFFWNAFQLDDALAYKVPKKVVIRDRRLGFFRLIATLVVLVYVCIKRLYLDQAYLKFERLRGAVEWKIDNPQESRFEEHPIFANLKVPSQLPYCEQYNGSTPSLRQAPCMPLSTKSLATESDDTVVFVATRFQDLKTQNSTCMQTDDYYTGKTNCNYAAGSNSNATKAHFVANAEDYVLTLRSAVAAVSTPERYFSSTQAPGKLHCAGSQVRDIKKWVRAFDTFDQLTMQELLDCAGVNIDDEVTQGRTFRFLGVTLFMTIVYEHDFWGSVVDYHYSVSYIHLPARRFVPDAFNTFRFSQSSDQYDHPLSDTSHELRYGIRVIMDFDGTQGEFSFSQLVMCFVEALALLKLASYLLIVFMITVMPERSVYRELLSQPTVDFNAYKAGDPRALAAVEYTKNHNLLLKGLSFLPTQEGNSSPEKSSVFETKDGDTLDTNDLHEKSINRILAQSSETEQELQRLKTQLVPVLKFQEDVQKQLFQVGDHAHTWHKDQISLLEKSVVLMQEQLNQVAYVSDVNKVRQALEQKIGSLAKVLHPEPPHPPVAPHPEEEPSLLSIHPIMPQQPHACSVVPSVSSGTSDVEAQALDNTIRNMFVKSAHPRPLSPSVSSSKMDRQTECVVLPGFTCD